MPYFLKKILSKFYYGVNIFPIVILATMFVLMLGAAWNDSAIMDELAHIPAGFGYVTQLDYRLNPEHPPLLKALAAAVSELIVHPNFPTDTQAWRDDINGQWAQGTKFLYESGNDADRIIFWARFPLMLLAIVFGWLLYAWTKKQFGSDTALLTLLFYAFSPTFLAHSHYVTTDLGASLGFFLGITAFILFLENPSWKNIWVVGIIFGLAQVLKFSLVLLVPIYVIMILGKIVALPYVQMRERMRLGIQLIGKLVVLGAIGMLTVWLVYTPFVWNYPPDRQLHDAQSILQVYTVRPLANLNLAFIQNKFTRPFGEYMLGVLMVTQRAAGGNTQYFFGTVSATGTHIYFPLLYFIKEPLSLHILTLLALLFGLYKIIRSPNRSQSILVRIRMWTHTHFVEFSAFSMLGVYWASSIASPLNIGVRHVLPTFPFIYILVSKQTIEWLHYRRNTNPLVHYLSSIPKYLFVGLVMAFLVTSTLSFYPYFLSYYNPFGGGIRNGWIRAVDSNYDWGQDLKRLTAYVEENNIDHIAVDYFGGGSPKYYLGEKFEPWWSSKGPAHGWFAVSATFRQSAFGTPVAGFVKKPEDSYEWLQQYEPVTRVGSIFIYNLP